jgi:hypothetical protein
MFGACPKYKVQPVENVHETSAGFDSLTFNFSISSLSHSSRLRYHSRCGDHCAQPPAQGPRHCVSSQTLPHFGHLPPVSKVCQEWPHEQPQRSVGWGSQSHFGQAIFTSAMLLKKFGAISLQKQKNRAPGYRSNPAASMLAPVPGNFFKPVPEKTGAG